MSKNVLKYILPAIVLFTACKKSDGGPSPDETINDEVLEETKNAYLWYQQIPANFDYQRFEEPDDLMMSIRNFSQEPGFTQPVDDFSFAMKKTEWDALSAGVTTDYGLNVFFYSDGDLRVRAVEEQSPAGVAGIRRGWQIVKIDGNSSISVNNADFISRKIYNSSSVAIEFKKPDGSTTAVNLTAATYTETPVLLDTMYTIAGRKVAYLVFNSFLGDRTRVEKDLAIAFNRFLVENVKDVIVDLRYNGGGYVSLQQTLANFLVPSSASGQVMMTEEYNDRYSSENKTVKFAKKGHLEPEHLYFIVSANTASASELLINNLAPYIPTTLVGEATYGKPVGFFPIPVGDWYIFPVSFRTVNSEGAGNYFNGLPVNREVPDGLDKDWGDTQESRLAAVLTHVATGHFGFVRPSDLNSVLEQDLSEGNRKLGKNIFKGAIAGH